MGDDGKALMYLIITLQLPPVLLFFCLSEKACYEGTWKSLSLQERTKPYKLASLILLDVLRVTYYFKFFS